ncbi:MAG TPA: hypothetical protein DHV42_08880 [Lachnospiraceae bacterium]|nr:hypothetical protein [Lachnospiraceae bacterium]
MSGGQVSPAWNYVRFVSASCRYGPDKASLFTDHNRVTDYNRVTEPCRFTDHNQVTDQFFCGIEMAGRLEDIHGREE